MKDAKVGETYMGMEPMTKFLSVTVSTRFGDVELCHPFELVAEEQKDNVKPGAIVSTLCTLSGDAAIGEYAGGAVYSEEKALELLRYFFQRGGAQRLRGAMRSDGAVTFLANRQEGPDSALALLETVGQQLREADLDQCEPGTVTGVDEGGETPAPCLPGKRCLLLGDGLPGTTTPFCAWWIPTAWAASGRSPSPTTAAWTMSRTSPIPEHRGIAHKIFGQKPKKFEAYHKKFLDIDGESDIL